MKQEIAENKEEKPNTSLPLSAKWKSSCWQQRNSSQRTDMLIDVVTNVSRDARCVVISLFDHKNMQILPGWYY